MPSGGQAPRRPRPARLRARSVPVLANIVASTSAALDTPELRLLLTSLGRKSTSLRRRVDNADLPHEDLRDS
jgi:hypothetical protein